jgi:hypothetical protein
MLAQMVSATTTLNIYLDEKGDATFVGRTNEQLANLPQGIKLQNGAIYGIGSQLTSKNGDVWLFNFSLMDTEMRLMLPEGASIRRVNGGEIGIYDSMLYVISRDFIEVYYTLGDSKKNNNLLIYLIIGTFGAAVLAFLAVKIKKITEEKKSKLSIIKQVLNEREKLILDKAKKIGKIKMSYLRKMCDIPKASFSRHLQELEKKKLIRRSGFGKNKFVEVKDA